MLYHIVKVYSLPLRHIRDTALEGVLSLGCQRTRQLLRDHSDSLFLIKEKVKPRLIITGLLRKWAAVLDVLLLVRVQLFQIVQNCCLMFIFYIVLEQMYKVFLYPPCTEQNMNCFIYSACSKCDRILFSAGQILHVRVLKWGEI